jgi:7-cyano-7-deazaguanine synthase in queuosine biosynthesis/intein/homing endonuclease
MSQHAKPAVVLLSGGLDSTTTLAIAKHEGFQLYALTFQYGQRHAIEIAAARRVAQAFDVERHVIVEVDLRVFGGSALTDELAVPKNRPAEEISHGIPITYVPARNTIFLAYALAFAEVIGAEVIFLGANVYDYSVDGHALVWVRTARWAKLMPIQDFYALNDDEYQTVAVDPQTLQLEWRRVTGRLRHRTDHKRCFCIRLERGLEITITEDHSLFTIDPATASLVTVKGSQILKGMPIVVPYDLSDVSHAWWDELSFVDLSDLPRAREPLYERPSIIAVNGYITNRLGLTKIPVNFPITDEFLYLIGLWLAEGGKKLDSRDTALRLSIGGIPGAVKALRDYFHEFNVAVKKSPTNDYDYSVSSSVFAALFWYFGLFGTAKGGKKAFPSFFWSLSQRQRRLIIAGLWDGDGGHVFKHACVLAQKSHRLIDDMFYCFSLDGIFSTLGTGRHAQKFLIIRRSQDFRRFTELYPLRHRTKRLAYEARAEVKGRDQATGLWKCPGLWYAVASARLRPGEKTRIYNSGGKYDVSYRAQRSAFASVPFLHSLVASKLAFLRVVDIRETSAEWMYDLAVEGAENFVANGILAHNSGYPDCRPEYIQAFEAMANLATKAAVEGRQRLRIHTPLIDLNKAQIIRRGIDLGVDYALTHSCYDPGPDGSACGECDSCLLRLKGFKEAGVADPIAYRTPRSPSA